MKGRGSGIGYPGPLALLLVWTVIGGLSYGRHYLQDRSSGPLADVGYQFLTWQTCFLPWAGLTPIVFRLERKWPLGGAKWPAHFTYLALSSLPMAYVGAALSRSLNAGIEWAFGRSLDTGHLWGWPPLAEWWWILLIYWSVVVAAYVIRNLICLRQREQEAAELALQKAQLESSLRQAELEMLRSRLNPHFLFNCLQNISVLTHEDPRSANQMLTRLGDLLRAALRSDAGPETTLRSEIGMTERYVEVERIRFGERLSVLFDVAPETESALVPTFLLQPLVENAIVHGLREVERGGIISIRSRSDSGTLALSVTDNGVGLPAEGRNGLAAGVGLTSTCERLARMYPEQHAFSMRALPEGGTEVRLEFPLRYGSTSTGVATHEQAAFVDRR